MNLEDMTSLLQARFKDQIVSEDHAATPKALIIRKEKVKDICTFCRDHDQLFFDMLSCLTGIDNGPETGTMELVYNLYSIPFNHHLMLKVELYRKKPTIESVSDVWKTANWHEREAYDLLGIKFANHPDLRRILLPNDWIGHPLRKDYKEQDKYHGITVVYDRENDES